MENLDPKAGIIAFFNANFSEWIGLIAWLTLVEDGQPLLGAVALWAGLLVERIGVVWWLQIHKRLPMSTIVPKLIYLAAQEAVVWVIWLIVVDAAGHIAGGIVLLILIHIEHAVQIPELRFDHTTYMDILPRPRALIISLAEAAGGIVWLYLVREEDSATLGSIILLILLTIEHGIQGPLIIPSESANYP